MSRSRGRPPPSSGRPGPPPPLVRCRVCKGRPVCPGRWNDGGGRGKDPPALRYWGVRPKGHRRSLRGWTYRVGPKGLTPSVSSTPRAPRPVLCVVALPFPFHSSPVSGGLPLRSSLSLPLCSTVLDSCLYLLPTPVPHLFHPSSPSLPPSLSVPFLFPPLSPLCLSVPLCGCRSPHLCLALLSRHRHSLLPSPDLSLRVFVPLPCPLSPCLTDLDLPLLTSLRRTKPSCVPPQSAPPAPPPVRSLGPVPVLPVLCAPTPGLRVDPQQRVAPGGRD